MEYLKFSTKPSGEHKDKHHIIIVGAGIIGVCTAYYLTAHPKYDPKKYHITIIESKRVAGGASGKAGGLLALWAFPQQIVPLSFDLHQTLSNKYNGEKEWGYRRLTTVSLEGDLSGVQDSESDYSSEDEEEDQGEAAITQHRATKGDHLDGSPSSTLTTPSASKSSISSTNSTSSSSAWSAASSSSNTNNNIDPHPKSKEQLIEESYTHIVDNQDSDSSAEKPPKKTARNTRSSTRRSNSSASQKNKLPSDLKWINSSLIDSCASLGGTDTTAQVLPYKFTNFMLKKAVEYSQGSIELIIGKVEEIKYSMETGQATGVIYKPSSSKAATVDTVNERIELGGDQIVLSVGPWTSKILPDCPISGLRAHSITVAPFKDQPVSPYAIFTELKTGPTTYISPEIYARHDEVYVCGEGDSAVDVPETTDDVEVVKSKCDELFRQVGKVSPNLKRGHILKRQACYLPVLDVPSSSGPLIGETNVENLFLCSGHSCWGINNAPGTGKIMSELLLDGVCTSADISGLDPSLYFDASVLVSDDEDDESSSETGDTDSEWSRH
ncbi:putative oxidoreductase Tda3p [[Candida] railenensis]|uniref:Oxidoreductase Tda3p n=1 Tax=[Candida] railenensis TaxID=45579 RepID=A0A9P0QNN3_9ASCO|nr:putative oxidoreductase Tda3p [[Candida] railenensis]